MAEDIRREVRVAYFAGSMKPGHDGVTRVLYRLIEYLDRARIPSVFFSPIVPPEGTSPIPIHHVPSVRFPLYKSYRVAVPNCRELDDRLRDFRPDILHIHSPCSLGFAAACYGRNHGIPVVATYHTHFPSYAQYYRIQALEFLGWSYLRGLYNDYCRRVYVPSEPIRAELARRGLRNLLYLPHGVDSSAFHPRFRSAEWKIRHGLDGKSVVLYAGRLVWEKDLAVLAEASRRLACDRDDVVFVLAGDGPIRKDLQALMPGAVFLGHQSGEQLAETFASSDIFALPSTTETFGNVTAEAMASGVVPICARAGGAYGILRHRETGLITRPRDPGHLAEGIAFLLDHPVDRERIARNALAFARSLSWGTIFDRLFDDYRNLAGETRFRKYRGSRAA